MKMCSTVSLQQRFFSTCSQPFLFLPFFFLQKLTLCNPHSHLPRRHGYAHLQPGHGDTHREGTASQAAQLGDGSAGAAVQIGGLPAGAPPSPHHAPPNCAQEAAIRHALTLNSPTPTTLAHACVPKAIPSRGWGVGVGVGWRREAGWLQRSMNTAVSSEKLPALGRRQTGPSPEPVCAGLGDGAKHQAGSEGGLRSPPVEGGYKPLCTPVCAGLLLGWPAGPASPLASQGGMTGLIRLY